METITIEIPEGKRAEWVNGVLTLVDDKPQDTHIYKAGDKAILTKDTTFKQGNGLCLITKGNVVEIIYASYPNSDIFDIKFENAISTVRGEDLAPVIAKDITERIKTFEDACEWCHKNGKEYLVSNYEEFAITYSASHIALTCHVNSVGSHTEIWRPFISQLLYNMSSRDNGYVFILFGRQAQSFKPFIRGSQHIIEIEHPAYFARKNEKMPYSVFTDMNKYLKDQYNIEIELYKEDNG